MRVRDDIYRMGRLETEESGMRDKRGRDERGKKGMERRMRSRLLESHQERRAEDKKKKVDRCSRRKKRRREDTKVLESERVQRL